VLINKILGNVVICVIVPFSVDVNACLLAGEEESPKEPSLRQATSSIDVNGEDDRQDLSSIGDITIDSVKDHLL